MREHAADERIPGLREPVAALRIGEVVQSVGGAPHAPVDVPAVARLTGKWLGGQRGDEAVAERDAAGRLPERDLVVRGTERVGIADGQLLLSGPELRIALLGEHALRLERVHQLAHDRRRAVHADGREAEAPIERRIAVALAARQAELVLERGLELE